MRYYPLAKKCKLDSPWLGPYLVVSIAGWEIGAQLQSDSPMLLVHWGFVMATDDRPVLGHQYGGLVYSRLRCI